MLNKPPSPTLGAKQAPFPNPGHSTSPLPQPWVLNKPRQKLRDLGGRLLCVMVKSDKQQCSHHRSCHGSATRPQICNGPCLSLVSDQHGPICSKGPCLTQGHTDKEQPAPMDHTRHKGCTDRPMCVIDTISHRPSCVVLSRAQVLGTRNVLIKVQRK